MFVCGARTLVSRDEEGEGGSVEVKVLERHPFTSQTFIPLTADGTKRYLVVVAPTLEAVGDEKGLPVPEASGGGNGGGGERKLPGPGLPDLKGLKAFVATGEQAVTYAADTWHAPMMALGPEGSTVDFVVVQFANDVPLEDCQEVAIGEEEGDGDRGEGKGIWVRVLEGEGGGRELARL